jgi:hypothetical protein
VDLGVVGMGWCCWLNMFRISIIICFFVIFTSVGYLGKKGGPNIWLRVICIGR